jgi:hypothetical protein
MTKTKIRVVEKIVESVEYHRLIYSMMWNSRRNSRWLDERKRQ